MEYSYSRSNIDPIMKYSGCMGNTVDAVYTKALISLNEGNPMIEALPGALNIDEVKKKYYKAFPIKINKNCSDQEKLAEIQLIKDIRIPLPFAIDLETSYSTALAESYRKRFPALTDIPSKAILENMEIFQSRSFRTVMGGDTGIGVTLLGIGGCGKSAAIQTMLSHYPQVIRHSWPDDGDFVQIVWISAVTPANSNLNDLYITIASSIDEALNNTDGFYESQTRKIQSVGGKADYIAKLIKVFNIGSIILDEIQNLAHGATRASSFNSLMTIINTTKVALVVVGTEDAFRYMFGEYYIARRTGPLINACKYCTDRDHFNVMMKYITRLNWFETEFILKDELLDTLYKETSGVIDRMTSLWMDIQTAYVRMKKKPEIDSEFIMSVSQKRPFIAEYTEMTLKESLLTDFSAQKNSDRDMLQETRDAKKNKTLMDLMHSTKDPMRTERIYRRVKQNNEENGKIYNDSNIIQEVLRTLKLKKTQNYDDTMLVKYVLNRLNRKRSDRRSVSAQEKNLIMEEFTDTFVS